MNNNQNPKRVINHHRKRCAHTGADGVKCTGYAVNHNSVPVEERVVYCKRHSAGQHSHAYEKPDECPVCCEDTSLLTELKPCNHWLCKTCIDKMQKNECPYCRTKLTAGVKKNRYHNHACLDEDLHFESFMIQRNQSRRIHVEDFLETGRRLFNYPEYMSREELRYNLLANWWGSR